MRIKKNMETVRSLYTVHRHDDLYAFGHFYLVKSERAFGTVCRWGIFAEREILFLDPHVPIPAFARRTAVNLQTDEPPLRDALIQLRVIHRERAVQIQFDVPSLADDFVLVPIVWSENALH